jgi:YidC/Oxa1 family membrane protein insertase
MFKDRNTLIGLLLIFGIMIGYYFLTAPSQEEREKMQKEQDSLQSIAENREKAKQDSIDLVSAMDTLVTDTVSVDTAINEVSVAGPFISSDSVEETTYYIENDLLSIGISNIGGKIKSIQLKEYLKYDKTPLYLFNNTIDRFGLTFFSNNKPVVTDELVFVPVVEMKDSILALDKNSDDTLRFSLRLYPATSDSLQQREEWIEYRYTLVNGSYLVGFDIEMHNMKRLLPSNVSFINFEMSAEMLQQEKSFENEKNVTTIYYSFVDGEVDYLSERKNDRESLVNKVKWVSFKQQFFSFSLISGSAFQGADIEVVLDENIEDSTYLKTLKTSLAIPIEDANTFTIPMSLYAGPNKYNTLRDLNLGLERQIPLGWSFFLMHWINRFAVLPVFNYLEGFNMNYGIIILILTILLKIVLFPIAYKTYLSSARMKVLKPEIEEITKKFPKKEDSMKKQQATMELYKKAGVNPMSGCLPMLLQFPILIAMFRFFPASIELRQQAFLWADDLSSYDSILELGFNIPFYGSHVSLFTLLMTISTIIYTRVNSKMMSASTQMPGMKTMMYLMPIMFLGFFNSYSSALSYYYFLANMITFGQMALFNKFVNEDKIRDRIAENKKKPVKKSGFQQRLEQMAKQQQVKQKQGNKK